MVRATVTAKFPTSVVAVSDIGLFTNDVGKRLDADEDAASTVFNVEPDTSGFEVDMWLATRGVNGYEIVQIDAVDAANKTVTVDRAEDGTVAVAHKDSQDLRAMIPAKALNQMVAELVAVETNLFGATALFIRRDGSNSPTADIPWGGFQITGLSGLDPSTDNTADIGTPSLRWRDLYLAPSLHILNAAGDANDLYRLGGSGLQGGAGGASALDVGLSRGAANRWDVATGDDFNLILGAYKVANVSVIDASRNLVGVNGVAQDLNPEADATRDIGTPSLRYADIIGNAHLVYAALGAANPVLKLSSAGIEFGPGGAGALDILIERTGANALRIADDLTVSGNLIVNGTTTTVNSTAVSVDDNRILLNEGEPGAGVTAGTAGLEIDRGSLTDSWLVFDESVDRWRASYDAGGTFSSLAQFNDALSVFAATTSAQLAGVISDETGTGVLVFNNTPTLLTPTIASFANATHNHQAAAGGGTLDHGLALAGLTDDDHTQYALLAGRAGGQILIGGTAATDALRLRSTGGVGTTDAVIIQVGNNGGTEGGRWNNAGFLGLGTTTPGERLHVVDTMRIASHSDNAQAARVFSYKSRGTEAAPTIVTSGDEIGTHIFRAYDGAAYLDAAYIQIVVTGTPGVNDMPTRMSFWVTNDGASSPTERFRLQPGGWAMHDGSVAAPAAADFPANKWWTARWTTNTTLTFYMKGDDGTVRSGNVVVA